MVGFKREEINPEKVDPVLENILRKQERSKAPLMYADTQRNARYLRQYLCKHNKIQSTCSLDMICCFLS